MSEIEKFILEELESHMGYYFRCMINMPLKLEEERINECFNKYKKVIFFNIIKKYIKCELKDMECNISGMNSFLFLEFNKYICDIEFDYKNFEFNNFKEILNIVLNDLDLIIKYMKLKNIAPKINIVSKNEYVNYYVEIRDIKEIKKYMCLNHEIELLLMSCESKNLFNYLDKKIEYNFEEFKNKYLN